MVPARRCNYRQNEAKSSEAQIEAYQRCIALDPKHAIAHNNLGSVLKSKCSMTTTVPKNYRKAIELDPKQARVLEFERYTRKAEETTSPAPSSSPRHIRRGNPDNDGEQELARLRRKLGAAARHED